MAKGDYNISDIYQGGYNSFKPNYGDVFTGYHVPAASIGAPTKPDTANQLAEVSKLINQGMIPVEFSALSPEVFEAIPKQHFDEVRRMAKLTDTKISVHAPLIEASGIGKEGWTEDNREYAEKQLKEVVERSYNLDHRGDMPIVIHSANIPGTEYKMTPEGKKISTLIAIDRESGQPIPLKEDIMYTPGEKIEKDKISPEDSLRMANNTKWSNALREIEFSRENAERVLSDVDPRFRELYLRRAYLKENNDLSGEEFEMIKRVRSAAEFMHQAKLKLDSIFSNAYKFAKEDEDKDALKTLNEASKEYAKILGNTKKEIHSREDYEKYVRSLDPKRQSDAMFAILSKLEGIMPKSYIPIEEFALRQSSKTFGNVAFESFKKFGEKAPVISVENLYPGMAFSTGKDMNELLLKSKEQFVKKAVENGLSKSEAQKMADKKIGLTFDVGHLNIHRKHGFKEKDLLKEFKEMSKHVKHVHLTDNFGNYDSHLPLGMGNVPIGKYMEELEKQGYEGRKIVEAGGWAQHFGLPSHAMTLEATGSPIYSDGVGPYWNQSIGLQQGYSSGYGEMLPSIHYETFGSGFSNLPSEMGAQRGAGSRMSGRPME